MKKTNFIILIALLIQASLQASFKDNYKYNEIFRGDSGN